MKNLYLRTLVGILVTCLLNPTRQAHAQCSALPGGPWTQSHLNWDYLDFLPSANTNYTGSYVSGITPYNQNFVMGTRRVNFTLTNSVYIDGETAVQTADAGSDVRFDVDELGSTVMTITFDADVRNLTFSIYDIDRRQAVAINSKDGSGTDVTTTVTKRNAATIITLGGTATNPTATSCTSSGCLVADNSHDGTIDVSIAGPVRTVTLTVSASSGTGSISPEIYLGDLNACVTGSFPAVYRDVSRPFTGMPGYILTVVDNRFMLLDPATGKVKWLFTDPAHGFMNGMAYDPYNRLLYYTHSLTGTPSSTRSIYRYNANTEAISTWVANVNAAPLNIPTYTPGVTSGSASFYNGNLYFGVESANSSRTSGRENTVWRIDFDGTAAQNPVRASQVYATRSDSAFDTNNDGTPDSDRLIHDWADIGVANGMMYDFDGAGNGASNPDTMYYHFNLMTGQRVQFAPSGAGNLGPKQVAIDWQERVFNMGGLPTPASNAQTIGGFIVPYNYNGTVDNANNRLVFVNPGPTYPTGSWGDCSEAFRPLCDFGDAPASYDPDTWSPAVHEQDTMIRIGGVFDREWLKTSSTLADADGADEDGLAFVPFLSAGGPASYNVNVSVYNHTGAPATLRGWIDLNNNGTFDAGESSAAVTVNSSTSTQTVNLYWANAGNSFTPGQSTYMRIRFTNSGALGAANATGYYENGETEDYRVLIDNFPLSVNLLSFTAKAINKSHVKLDWKTTDEANFRGYEVYRSSNGSSWNMIGFVNATGNGGQGSNEYSVDDAQPLKGKSFYRIKMVSNDSKFRNSETRTVSIIDEIDEIIVYPNPATDNKAFLSVNSNITTPATLSILDARGSSLYWKNVPIYNGMNTIPLPVENVQSGVYIVRLQINDKVFSKQLIISR